MKEIDDKGFIPEGDLISSFWPDWEQPVTETPTIKREGSKITIECTTAGSSIGFQIVDPGEEVDNQRTVYTGSFEVSKGQEVVAIADRIGFEPSGISSELPKNHVIKAALN